MIAVAGYINYADGVKKKNAAANKTKEGPTSKIKRR